MDAQPGEKYVYGYNTDILGVVVEKVSGLTLAEFFQKRITGPLGLVDTQFYLPPAQKDRLAAVYAAKDDGRIERRRPTRSAPARATTSRARAWRSRAARGSSRRRATTAASCR